MSSASSWGVQTQWVVRWLRLPASIGLAGLLGCGGEGPVTPPPAPSTGSLSVTAANLPSGGATAEITPPTGSAQTVPLPYSQSGLPTGTYSIRGREVETPPTTYEPTQATVTATVQANQTTSATVSYQPIAPRLTATATGMPGGRLPPWSYTRDGQAGFGTLLGATAVVNNLPAGTYLIRAGAMLEGTTVYLPSVAIFGTQVANGVNQRVTVAWSPGAAVTDLTAGTPLGGLALPTGQSRIFRIGVPNGATELRVTVSGGTGDANLYLRPDSLPGFPSGVACAGETPGTSEVCVVPNPKAGTWYLHLAAVQAFQGVALSATTAGAAFVTLQGGPGSGRLQVPAVAGQAALDCLVTNGTTSGACEGSYPTGTTLAVTATPTPPSAFTGWTAGCVGNANPCSYQVAGSAVVRAGFAVPATKYRLTIVAGAGSVGGVVTSNPAGINCTISAAGQPAATGCAADFDANTVVRLTPSGANPLKNWDSACVNVAPTVPCDVTMAADLAAGVTFELPKPLIQVVSSLKRAAVGAIDPATTFAIPIANAGGGDLRIKQPLAAPQLNRGSGWITASVQYVGPTSSTLVLDIAPDKLRPLGRADFTARLVLEAEGTGQLVNVDFSIRPLVNTTPVLANRVVYFHYEPQNPLPELRTLLPFLGRDGQPLQPSQVQFQQTVNNWIKDVTVDGAAVSVVTRAVDPNTVNPDGNANQAVSVKVQTPTDRCDRINPNDNKHCTILAYYTRDQRPLMQLDPWGLVFTPTSPGPLEATIKAFNPQLGRLLPGARIKSDDCGPWVTAKSIVPGALDKFRAQIDFAAVPTDTTLTCNVIIAALMEEAGNPTDSTERSLEIVATRPPLDAITPEYPDLGLVATATQTTRPVLLYNFGAGALNLVSVVADGGTCPAGLLSARIDPARNLRLNDNRLTTAQAEVQLNRTGVAAGTTCAGSVTITASAGTPVTIPVTIKVP